MAYVFQRWIPSALRAAGLTVVEVEGWENRGRPASTGAFDPRDGMTVHHTGTTSSSSNNAPSLQTLIQGRSDLPGPLSQVATAYNGVVYMIAAGRANHAGQIERSGLPGLPLGSDGNAQLLGNEVMTNGTQTLPKAQRHSIAVVNKVCMDHFGYGAAHLFRHEDLTPRKWDIGQLSTSQIRNDAENLSLPEEDDMPSVAEVVDGIKDILISDLAGDGEPKRLQVALAYTMRNTYNNRELLMALALQVENLQRYASAQGKILIDLANGVDVSPESLAMIADATKEASAQVSAVALAAQLEIAAKEE